MDQVKHNFSKALRNSLKQAYGGLMPATTTVARDFALKSPHLSHVSAETIRKWMRGICLPHVSRMHVLIDWLGPALNEPFEKPVIALHLASQRPSQSIAKKGNGHNGKARPNNEDQATHDELIAILEKLTEKECQSILAIAKLLIDR
jgi:hypothetical protein